MWIDQGTYRVDWWSIRTSPILILSTSSCSPIRVGWGRQDLHITFVYWTKWVSRLINYNKRSMGFVLRLRGVPNRYHSFRCVISPVSYLPSSDRELHPADDADLVCQKARIIVHEPNLGNSAPSESSHGGTATGTGTSKSIFRKAGGELDIMQVQRLLEKNPDMGIVVSSPFLAKERRTQS